MSPKKSIFNKIENIYNQYNRDIFEKLNISFKKGRKILDIGCGPGVDSSILKSFYKLDVYAIDIYKDENIKNLDIKFKLGSIFDIPYKEGFFDYVFLHDILHHIDEKEQSYGEHIRGLKELKRVVAKGGCIVIVEGNRYNPLFYPHMVKIRGHEHFQQEYFKKIITNVFDDVSFKFFEAHYYPQKWVKFWKVYEYLMEKFCPKALLAYNVAIIKR